MLIPTPPRSWHDLAGDPRVRGKAAPDGLNEAKKAEERFAESCVEGLDYVNDLFDIVFLPPPDLASFGFADKGGDGSTSAFLEVRAITYCARVFMSLSLTI